MFEYGNGFYPQNGINIDQMYNTYKQQQQILRQQQQMLMNNPSFNPGAQNANASIGQQGMFKPINEYKEVENAPVAADGTPTLFFDFKRGIFYSKKFVDGQCSIQPYTFAPINNSPTSEPVEPSTPKEASMDELTVSAIMDKLDELTQRIEKLEPKKLTRVENKGE